MRYRYWDACTVLGWLKGETDKVNECKAVIDHAKRDELHIVTSAITLAEVLYLKGSTPIPVTDRVKVRRFFEADYIELYDVDRTIAEKAQDVVWDHGVTPKDAIHVATALAPAPGVVIEQLDTFDGGLIGLSGKVGSPALKIGRPDVQQGLF